MEVILFVNSSDIEMQSSLGINIFLLILSILIVLFGIAYQPLPDDFPEPWKYRFLSYWAEKIDQIVCKFYIQKLK